MRPFAAGSTSTSTPPSSWWSAPSIGASSGSSFTRSFSPLRAPSTTAGDLVDERQPRDDVRPARGLGTTPDRREPALAEDARPALTGRRTVDAGRSDAVGGPGDRTAVEVEAAAEPDRRDEPRHRSRPPGQIGDDEGARLRGQEPDEGDAVAGDADAGVAAAEGQDVGPRRRGRKPRDGRRARACDLDRAIGDGELAVPLDVEAEVDVDARTRADARTVRDAAREPVVDDDVAAAPVAPCDVPSGDGDIAGARGVREEDRPSVMRDVADEDAHSVAAAPRLEIGGDAAVDGELVADRCDRARSR